MLSTSCVQCLLFDRLVRMAYCPIHVISIAVNRRPGDVSRACWRSINEQLGLPLRWTARLLIPGHLALMIWVILASPNSMGFFFVALISLQFWNCFLDFRIGRIFRRFNRKVEQAECQLCIECTYSLLGLPDLHHCPECGTGFVAEENKAYWTSWIANTTGVRWFSLTKRHKLPPIPESQIV